MKHILTLSIIFIAVKAQDISDWSQMGLNLVNKLEKFRPISAEYKEREFVKNLALQGLSVRKNIKEEYKKRIEPALKDINLNPQEFVLAQKQEKIQRYSQPTLNIILLKNNRENFVICEKSDLSTIKNQEDRALITQLYNTFIRTGLQQILTIKLTLTAEEYGTQCYVDEEGEMYFEAGQNDSANQTAYLHELAHIGNRDYVLFKLFADKIASISAGSESMRKFRHHVELHADETFGCKNLYNAQLFASYYNYWHKNCEWDMNNTNPGSKSHSDQANHILQLLEAERDYLKSEWYRREYERSFYKSLKRSNTIHVN